MSLCFLATYPLWGVIALPLRSLLYVREKDVPSLGEKYGWKFRTKLELAVDLVTWFLKSVRSLGVECKIWLVTDGAYAGRQVLKPLTDYFCTDAQVAVRDILETVAARWAIEEHFHDVKEIWGAGPQQVRNIWSNTGCWHLNQWMYTLQQTKRVRSQIKET